MRRWYDIDISTYAAGHPLVVTYCIWLIVHVIISIYLKALICISEVLSVAKWWVFMFSYVDMHICSGGRGHALTKTRIPWECHTRDKSIIGSPLYIVESIVPTRDKVTPVIERVI